MCFIRFLIRGYQMAGVMRALTGIGLSTLGFQLGRAVGRTDPVVEEWKRMRRRRGVVINSELADEEPAKMNN